MKDPEATWERARNVLGIAAIPFPRTAFGVLARTTAIPIALEETIEPSRPLVAIVCDDDTKSTSQILAWKVEAPDRLARFDPDRFDLSTESNGVRWLHPRAGSTALANLSLGVADRFFVAGSNERIVASHAPYLTRGLAANLPDVDVRLEVTPRGARSAIVARAISEIDRIARAIDVVDPDAPSTLARVSRDMKALALAAQGWAKSGDAMRVEVSVTADAFVLALRPLDRADATIRAEISGEIVRWWLRSHAENAISNALSTP